MDHPPSVVRGERGTTTIVLSAVLTAIVGAALLAVLLTQPRLRVAEAGEPVTVGPLSLVADGATWIGHDMSSMGPMPMEGTPAPGTARMRVRVLMSNRSAEATRIDAHDFKIVAGSGAAWTPLRATLPVSSDLPAGASVVGDLFFEVSADETDFDLTLARDGTRAVMALAVPGSAAHAREHAERNSP